MTYEYNHNIRKANAHYLSPFDDMKILLNIYMVKCQ